MLLKLEIENFYSIRDRHVLDLRLPQTTPEDERFILIDDERLERVPAVIALLGANASGKTSVLRAPAFLSEFVVRSFEHYGPGDPITVDPFACGEFQEGLSTLAVEFAPQLGEFRGLHCRYEVGIKHSKSKANYVAFERYSEAELGKSLKSVFSLDRTDAEKTKITASKDFNLKPSDPRRSVRENVSLVSSLVQFGHEPSERIARIFRQSFVSNLSVNKYKIPEESVNKIFAESEDLRSAFNSVIRSVDIGIESMDVIEVDGKPTPIFRHRGLDGIQTLHYESEGTKSFYLFFPILMFSLGGGATAIIDELDSDIHPSLIGEVMSWYQDPEHNKKKGQLIFTANTPSILHEAEKEEVWIVEKDEKGASTIQPLAEVKGLRRDTNLYTKYLGGVLGGMPRFG